MSPTEATLLTLIEALGDDLHRLAERVQSLELHLRLLNRRVHALEAERTPRPDRQEEIPP